MPDTTNIYTIALRLQENTFLNCFSLDNFNDIPVNWRGGNVTI